jgi:hypothetical protein
MTLEVLFIPLAMLGVEQFSFAGHRSEDVTNELRDCGETDALWTRL